jgi:hypothetical protein
VLLSKHSLSVWHTRALPNPVCLLIVIKKQMCKEQYHTGPAWMAGVMHALTLSKETTQLMQLCLQTTLQVQTQLNAVLEMPTQMQVSICRLPCRHPAGHA